MKNRIRRSMIALFKKKKEAISLFGVLAIWILVFLDINVFRHLKGAPVVIEWFFAMLVSMFILETLIKNKPQ